MNSKNKNISFFIWFSLFVCSLTLLDNIFDRDKQKLDPNIFNNHIKITRELIHVITTDGVIKYASKSDNNSITVFSTFIPKYSKVFWTD